MLTWHRGTHTIIPHLGCGLALPSLARRAEVVAAFCGVLLEPGSDTHGSKDGMDPLWHHYTNVLIFEQ